MAEFTKEELIRRARFNVMRKVLSPKNDQSGAAIDARLAEIALAALTAEPFMYGIVGPEGEAYFDECCVSGGKSDLSEIVSNLNDQCESPGEEYREAPLYRMPMLEVLK